MNRKKFFDIVRKTVFRGKISPNQEDGLSNLLDVWENYYADQNIQFLAYNLATAYHETAHTMQPIMEIGNRSYFNKYEPGTRLGRILGNTQKGDGYRFRGAGHVQNTGRRNARVATEQLNKKFDLGVDLEENPMKRLDPFVSAHSLFLGNLMGWWTGKGLGKYIDDDDRDEYNDYMRARYVVNGTDKRALIAGYAVRFENALRAAGMMQHKPGIGGNRVPRPEPDETSFGTFSTVRKGDKGEYVEILIKVLHEMGYYKGKLDDYFWTQTEKAVKDFQKRSGLVVDGIVGPKTWAVLEKAYDGRKADKKDAEVAGASLAVGGVTAASLVALPVDSVIYMDWGFAALVGVTVSVIAFVVARALGE